jgi:MYXO-CTERM domain-containing protein
VWSLDRFVRAFTFTGDVSLPINLSTAKDPKSNPNGGLLPVLGGINIAPGATLSNNDLLVDDPALVAGSISSLLGGIAGQFLGALKPVDLSNSLAKFGLGMTIPDGGIRKLTKDTDDFIGIFADLSLAKGNAVAEADVQAKIVQKVVHPEAMGLTTADRNKLPELHMALSSSLDNGSHFVEYSYAVDDGTRSAWVKNRDLVIKDDSLFLQGKHVLHVWAREVGVPQSESTKSADVPFTIDVLAPMMKLETVNDALDIQAWDIVSATDTLQMRTKTSGDFGPWTAVHSIPTADLTGASSITVEVKDEEGNVASQSQPLVRGRADGTTSVAGGCGCVVASSSDLGNWAYGMPGLAGLFALGMRRRQRRAARTEVK